ncbi:MAG: A/G-specific adenine glycosylase [bacterium]|nr:A/G-specific adenine glycosylase [bacterium]
MPPAESIAPSSQKASALRRALLGWYDRARRNLPWRRDCDPYRVWISEIMLQQTRVETVIDYFNRFIAAFPTVSDLARAREDRVLKLWEGLGYYSRARNLHAAAKTIAGRGKFPHDAAGWRELPGVGRYTAGAIASIALGERAAVVDGNVKRVLARLFLIEAPIEAAASVELCWSLAERLVPPKRPGDFNQAMMELGARVCLPRKPLCSECPLRAHCAALKANAVERLPVRKAKPKPPHVQVVAAAIRKNGRYLLGRRPPSGMLGGLWEFPGGKVEPGETYEEALERELREELGVGVRVGERVVSVDHAYTHLTVTIHLYRCELIEGEPRALHHTEIKWVARSRFGQYAFPKANLKFLDLL